MCLALTPVLQASGHLFQRILEVSTWCNVSLVIVHIICIIIAWFGCWLFSWHRTLLLWHSHNLGRTRHSKLSRCVGAIFVCFSVGVTASLSPFCGCHWFSSSRSSFGLHFLGPTSLLYINWNVVLRFIQIRLRALWIIGPATIWQTVTELTHLYKLQCLLQLQYLPQVVPLVASPFEDPTSHQLQYRQPYQLASKFPAASPTVLCRSLPHGLINCQSLFWASLRPSRCSKPSNLP